MLHGIPRQTGGDQCAQTRALFLVCSASRPFACRELRARKRSPTQSSPTRTLANGVLTVDLEIRKGRWHSEAEDGPQLFVQAFGEAGKPSQIPGPMLRMPEGTALHIKVTNKLTINATVYGLNTRPGDAKDPGFVLKAKESRELSFVAGAPGTYYYWARTTQPTPSPTGSTQPIYEDAPLNGAYIVDPPGPVTPDRVFVINTMFAKADVIHPTIEFLSINGKSYPFTEPLEYAMGENIRWRVINPGFAEHPMHLHGAFYRLLSLGDFHSRLMICSLW